MTQTTTSARRDMIVEILAAFEKMNDDDRAAVLEKARALQADQCRKAMPASA